MTGHDDWDSRREKIIGLGENSLRKSYYPELKRRLEELERFRTLLDYSNDAIFLVEAPSNQIIDVNKRVCDQLGYTRSEILTRVLNEFVPEVAEQKISGVLCDLDYQETGITIITQLQLEGCDILPVEILVQRVVLGGQIYGILVARDISARLKMEEVLRKSEERYLNLFEGMPIGLYRITPEGEIIDVNPALAEMLHYSDRAVLLATSVYELYVDRNERLRWQSLVEKEGVVRNFEVQFRRLDGTVIWVQNTARAVFDDQGNVLFYEGSLEDVTERRRIQKELENHRKHLEIMVRERTLDLEQANEQLRILSRVKDEFVSNVSHELRTPITSLKLRQYLLAGHPEDHDRHTAAMQREIDRLEQIIESLLYLSRLDQNRVEWHPKLIDLNEVVRLFVDDRKVFAQHRDLKLTFTAGANLSRVEADVALLEQALSVLITNALNYTPAGGHIHVSTQTCNKNGHHWVSVLVQDTGAGIVPEEQKHLFERFFRGSAGRQSGVPGTGLGLSIVQEIINKHQGLVEVISEGVPGKGTTFILSLLAKEAAV